MLQKSFWLLSSWQRRSFVWRAPLKNQVNWPRQTPQLIGTRLWVSWCMTFFDENWEDEEVLFSIRQWFLAAQARGAKVRHRPARRLALHPRIPILHLPKVRPSENVASEYNFLASTISIHFFFLCNDPIKELFSFD